MGKIYGIGGIIRGKIGSLVYYKGADGSTYARTYQPTVMNPKSVAQLVQRARVTLAGKISAVTPSDVLTAFGFSGKRKNRSAYTSSIVKGAEVTQSEGVFTAKINPADVKFSRGVEVAHAEVSTPVSVTAHSMTVGLTLSDVELANKYGERIIVALMKPEDAGVFSAILSKDVLFADGTEVQVGVRFPDMLVNGTLVSVYRVPFVLSDEGAAIAAMSLYSDDGQWVSGLVKSQSNLRGWGQTLFTTSVDFTTA